MKDQNLAILTGHLVRDPEIKVIKSGQSVVNFSIAVDQDYKKSDGEKVKKVSYVDCQAWQKLAEIITQYAKKGMLVLLNGDLNQQTWEDGDGKKRSKIIINVNYFRILSGKKDHVSEPEPQQTQDVSRLVSDDDIPF